MKKIFFTLIALSILNIQVANGQLPSSSSGDFEPPCLCCPPFRMLGIDCIMPPDVQLSEDLDVAITDCHSTMKELNKASKYARPITSRINSLLKKVNIASLLPQATCKKLIQNTASRLDSLITKLQSKACSETITTGCILQSVIDEFLPVMQEEINDIKAILQTDDDETGIPDLCRG